MNTEQTYGDSAMTPAKITKTLLFWCGLVYFLLLPYHQVLRSFTAAPAIIAWKEALQGIGIVLLFAHLFVSRARGIWNWVVIVWAVLTAMVLPSVRMSILTQSIDTILLLIGPACTGFYFYCEIRQFYETEGKISPSMKLLFSAAIIISLWIILGGRLGLDRYVFHEDPEWAFYREGVVRVTGPFDSPMSAGQYLWILGTIAMAAALFATNFATIGLLFALASLCYIAVLYTASRGPYIIVGCSTIILLGAGLWVRSPSFWKKAGILTATSAVGIIIVASIIDAQTLETYLRIFNSSLSSHESSNAERNTRIAEGFHGTFKYLPWGKGLEWFPVRNLVGTNLIYENTYLGLGVALGARGLLMGAFYAGYFLIGVLISLVNVFRRRAPAALMAALIIPWLAYSMMYPQLQGRFSTMISWAVVGSTLGCIACLMDWNREQ